MRKSSNAMRFKRLAALVLCALTLAAGCGHTRQPAPSASSSSESNGFSVTFLNVGHGDCALLELPGGKWAMVDTGPADGFAAVNGMLRLRGIRRLEAVFISHPHSDHIGGLDGVLDIAHCPTVYTTPVDFGKPTGKMKETADAHGAAVKKLLPGQSVEIAGVTFTAVGPNGTFDNENDNSLALMACYRGFSVLFAGDQSLDAEAALLKSGYSIDCDVLKVGHHGEEDATSEAFVRAASPLAAIVTSPASLSDTPSPIVLARLESAGAKVSILGKSGSVTVSSLHPAPVAVTPPQAPPALQITAIDAKAEYIEITNPTDAEVDMTGWGVLSDKGNQFYAFPDGFTLRSGGTVRIYSGMKESDTPAGGLFWTDKNIWRDKKSDRATLVDPYGRIASDQ